MNREHFITSLACMGLPNKQIAHRAGVSERTVETHLHRAMSKHNVNSRAQLIILQITGERPWEA